MKVLGLMLLFVGTVWGDYVTCPNTGNFTNDPPFDGWPLPYCEDELHIYYEMYTRLNRNFYQTMDRDTIPSLFDPSRMTFFIVHGWDGYYDSDWLFYMMEVFVDRVDSNVVVVAWGDGYTGVPDPTYPESASTTRVVGADLGDVINNLVENAGAVKSKMWCAGFALGAHVCGFAGRRHNQLGRITGMDPAGPEFVSNPDRQIGLWTDCADFVDTINTDPLYGSTPLGLGHQNHYPNGGYDQPGCSETSTPDLCSHYLAHEFMYASINGDCFIARENCTNSDYIPGSCSFCGDVCAFMGYGATPSSANGDYYLTTDPTSPYCQN